MPRKNIPAILFAGMFFFSAPGFCDRLALAEDLFRKEEWELCHRECRRALLDGVQPAERFALLSATSSVRTGATPEQAIPLYQAIIAANRDPQVTAIASYELGRQQWQLDQPAEAFDSFATAFNNTTNSSLFLHSACSLFLLMKEHPELQEGHEALVSQINTSRDRWFGALFSQCAKPTVSPANANAPGWFIRFYRSQVSPAIGDRCNLEPSCSEYYRQAKVKHGWLAIPMIGDRFFREPEANNLKREPLVMEDGHIRYRDPVEYHDFWMNK